MKPRIEDAPGLVWKPRRHGKWEARWQARTDLVKKRGYKIKSLRLWVGTDPTEAEVAFIQDRCIKLQNDMLVFARGGVPIVAAYDGTLASLATCYQTDPDSKYVKPGGLRYKTREHYDTLIKKIVSTYGETRIADIKARQAQRWYEDWAAGGKVSVAHAAIGMLRTLINFGMTYMECDDCAKVSAILHNMRFKMAKPRSAVLTSEQAAAVRAKAHEMGFHSIALAQAIQFECMLRQKDVIGEWVPISEPGVSDTTNGNEKWLRGIRWEEIDENLILRHITSKRQKAVQKDLKLAPMVLEEFQKMGELPANGPVIVFEKWGRPYTAHEFRRRWRKIATACGVPSNVKNMDSRAGAITEAFMAGANMESVRKSATHSTSAMTSRYDRGDAEASDEVARHRAEFRNKKGT